jgi:uncharacterized Zn finger protein
MSRWDPSWPRTGPKKPPPEHGLKVKKVGTTWWGQRWIEALEHVLRGDSGRLGRGKTYARAGRTHDLVIVAGKVRAKVTGSRAAPYEVGIELAQLPVDVWRRAIAGMAEKAQFAAELLAGQMPLAIDDVFRQAGLSLFPVARAELVTTCSCPDWGDPCKHVAATHFVLGEALDRDPFLLFELRGRSKEQVLAGIRAARGAGGATGVPATGEASAARNATGAPIAPTSTNVSDNAATGGSGGAPIATVTLGVLDASDYDRAPVALPALDFSFEAPLTHGALLRQLGAPAAWRAEGSPAELLAPLVQRAAGSARRIALGEPEPPATTDADPSEPRPRRKKKPLAKREVPRSTKRDRAPLDAKREVGRGTNRDVGTPLERTTQRAGAGRKKRD